MEKRIKNILIMAVVLILISTLMAFITSKSEETQAMHDFCIEKGYEKATQHLIRQCTEDSFTTYIECDDEETFTTSGENNYTEEEQRCSN